MLDGKYNEKCDVWSCGVIMYIMLCGYPPFNGVNDKYITEAVMEAKLEFPIEDWYFISTEAIDLIQKLLTKNVKKRITAKQALKHKWIMQNYKSKKVSKKIAVKAFKNLKNFKFASKL